MEQYIVITGGELLNKGAQSMTFNVVNRMKERYPDKKIILLSTADYKMFKGKSHPFNFEILPTRFVNYINLLNSRNIFKRNDADKQTEELRKILENTVLNIDISGFRLSSQFGSPINDISYLITRKVMKKFKIKEYIFPQSYGPFNYKFPYNLILKNYLLKSMRLPELVFCREDEGFNNLKKYTHVNLRRSYDSVLYSKEYELERIFKEPIAPKKIEVKRGSVGVVPNSKLYFQNKDNKILDVYKNLIESLLKNDREVYIFRHSVEDLEFCKDIKAVFSSNEKVHLIEDDLYCFELQDLIAQFHYIIGSRYHSIVHSYLFNVPSLIIGWSFKYKELAEAFGQKEVMFDIRESLNLSDFDNAVSYLEENHSLLTSKIETKMAEIRREDIFDHVKL